MRNIYYYLTTLLLLFAWQVNGQVLNEAANWPNAAWVLSGTFDGLSLFGDPTVDATFSFDDDNAGSGSSDEIFLESPVIDLTAANTAGESLLTLNAAGYSYYQSSDDLLLEYYDVDASSWVLWDDFVSNGVYNDYLGCNDGVLLSSELDISGFSATNLSGFKYRIHYNDAGGWKYGFCIQSPTLTSAAPPTCPSPSLLASANIGSDTADISWTTGGATAWIVEYGTPGFTHGAGTELLVSSAADTTLVGLTSSTDYEVYVRDYCGVGDSSVWFGPITFTTLCGTYTPNYLEDFSSYIPNCWSEGTGSLVAGPTGTSSGWLQDDFANVGANGKAARVEIYYTGGKEWLISPAFDLSAGGYELNFDVALTLYGATGSGTINLDDTVFLMQSLDNGVTWTDIYSWNNSNSPSNTGDNQTIDISSLTSSSAKFAFVSVEGATSGGDFDFFIDNFQVRIPPSCPKPTTLASTNIGSDAFDISWTTGGATTWIVEYGTPGFTHGAGTELLVSSAADTTLVGLTPNTDYEVYVRDYCGVGDSSVWFGPITVTTLPDYCAGDHFYDNGGTSDYSSNDGLTVICPNNPGDVVYVTFLSFEVEGRGLNDCYDWLHIYDGDDVLATEITPSSLGIGNGTSGFCYESPTDGTANLTGETIISSHTSGCLTFDFNPDGGGVYSGWEATVVCAPPPTCPKPSALASYNVGSDTVDLNWITGGASNWIIEYDTAGFTQGTGNFVTVNVDTFTTLTGLTPDTDYEVYLRDSCGPGDLSVWVGPISFTTLVSCPVSTNLSASLVSQTEVQLSWDVISSANSFQIEYGFDGFVQGSTDGTYEIAGTNPFNITGLQADTTYDFYVRDICAPGDTSEWLGPISVFTGYCLVENTSPSDYLDSISTTGAFLNVAYTANSQPTNGYANETSQIVETYPNGTFDIFTSYAGGPNGVKVWIDFNNDFDFDDLGEEVFFLANGDADKTGTITIPLSTALGSYRMRVRARYGTTTDPISCGSQSWGSTVDFTLNVVAPPPCVVPSTITSTVLSYDSVQLDWTAGATETEWIVEYNVVGNATVMTANATATTDTLFNLLADTDYEYRVRSYCGVGDSSIWSSVKTFSTPVSCPAPTALVLNEVGIDTASLSWTTGGASSWIVEYGTAGYTPGTGTLVVDTFIVLTGLSPETSYDFYVRDFCGTADSSVWVQTTFTTLCGVTSVFPAVETFDALTPNNSSLFSCVTTDNITNCWSNDLANTNNWIARSSATSSSGTGPSADHTSGSGNYVFLEASSCLNNTSYIYSTEYDVSSLTTPRLKFWYHLYGADMGSLSVEASTDGGATWSASLVTITGDQGNNWLESTTDLSAYSGATSLILRFTGVTGIEYESDMAIDDVKIEETPSCEAPVALLNSNVSTDTVDLSWTSNGTGTVYEIAYGAIGFTPTATADVTNVLDTFYTLTGLNSSTDYDVYVRTNCGAGDSSVWAGPTTFTTIATCLAPINLDASSFGLDSAVVSWETNGIASEWEVEYDTAGFTPTGVPTLTNIIDTFTTVSGLTSGTEYDFYVRSRCSAVDSSVWSGPYSFTTLPDYCAGDLFVDNGGLTGYYSNNARDTVVICASNPGDIVSVTFNSFDTEANWDGLLIYDGPSVASPLISSNNPVTVGRVSCPPGAWSGTTTYALTGANATQTSTDVSGCLTFVFGSDVSGIRAGWDATVTCTPRPANDIAVTEVLNLSAVSCGEEQSVIEVVVSNLGIDTQFNVPVTVEVTGDFTQTYTVTVDTILSLEAINLVVDSFNTTAGGIANIVAYSDLSGDVDLSNDTTQLTVDFTTIYASPTFTNLVYNLCAGDSVDIAPLTGGSYFAWFDDANGTNLVYDDTLLNYNYDVDTVFYVGTADRNSYTYELELDDYGYGEGWDGGANLIITADGVPVVGSPFTVSTGYFATFTFDVYDGQVIEIEYVAGSSYNDENEYYLYDENSDLIFEDYDFINGPTPGVSYTGTVGNSLCLSDLTMITVNVNPTYNDTVVVAACDEFTYSLGTVNVSGFYTDSLLTASGCDSVTTFNVTVNNSTSQTQTLSLCLNDTIVVGNNEYSSTGVYVDTLLTALGCDSIVTTDLTVNIPAAVTITGLTPTICEDAGVISVNTSPLGGVLSGTGISGNNFNPASAGQGVHTISYSLTDANNCSSNVSVDVEVINCTGIKDISGINAMTIYPNPFINTLNLTFNDSKSGELTINLFDVTGKVIVTKVVDSNVGVNNVEIVVPEFAASGVHIIQIERDGKTYTHSLLKK